ncbi:hypothetical protein [Rickettsia endosymbiont of Nabis limbatus]|uniref:hypothetical protein n=1 Tax=Rickettsia endosymbiont of Nabis limbatus TaxID=3066268 RepID=UPI003AF34027
MFKITRAARQILKSTSNIKAFTLSSIKAIDQYLNPSKSERFEDARHEFYFESFTKILPQQSVSKDHFRASAPIFQETNKLNSTSPYNTLEASDIRKLIYARFASEIVAKSKNAEGSKNFETKSYDTKEHTATFTTYDIANEFNDLRTQGYDFAGARKAIENQNVMSIAERIKELSISGYLSNYAGHLQLREDIEKVIIQKDLVINEFMARVVGKVEELEEYSSELLG